jgi:L-ascorbate metabolism protein UlaG (beta-lactamase superfamily)
MADASLTWLGHASFRLDTPGGKRVYVDPWLANPKCPDAEKEPERIDVIALTHGHSDHVGETVELLKKFEPKAVVAMVELKGWLKDKGAKVDDLPGPNKGGTVDVDGLKFTLVNAFHSSGAEDGAYTGEAAGLVVTLEDGRAIYFAGDTCVFSDMQLIGVKRVVPCHYGTFPLLPGTPEELKQHASGVEIHAIQPGESLTV